MGLTFPPPAERSAVLEEALQVLPALLRGEEVHFEGDHFQVKGAVLRPPAAQQPYVPVLVAGGGAKTTLRLTARYADANNMAAASWAGGAFTAQDVKAKFEVLSLRCDEAGRAYDAILRTTQVGYFLADTEAEAAAMRDVVMNDPARSRIMQFLERVPMFCTPAQAIDHLMALRGAGFQHFVVSGLDGRSIDNFASKVMRPLLDRVA
jgi:alkanesulfonate monooxygenase SsuD/methylene tetrahydromethanopterin reductase-like flavin-dependent oxidoreductase (luciferase family)